MKKILLTLSLVFVCSAVVFAGDSTEVKQEADKTEQKMENKEDNKESKASESEAPEIITTKSGLQYFDTKIGDGAEAKKGSQIEAHYTGWLYIDGKKSGKHFDSSLDRGTPIAFQLGAGRMIRGWDEGLVGVKVGGKRTLIIPPDLGYGKRGHPPVIPANSTLIFECEMVSVK